MDKLSPVPNLNKHIYSSIDSDVHPGVLTIKKTKDRMLPALAKHNNHEIFIRKLRKREAKNSSDVDVYSEAGYIKTLIDQGYLEVELKETLGKDVDLIFIGSSMDVSFQKQLEQGKIGFAKGW